MNYLFINMIYYKVFKKNIHLFNLGFPDKFKLFLNMNLCIYF